MNFYPVLNISLGAHSKSTPNFHPLWGRRCLTPWGRRGRRYLSPYRNIKEAGNVVTAVRLYIHEYVNFYATH